MEQTGSRLPGGRYFSSGVRQLGLAEVGQVRARQDWMTDSVLAAESDWQGAEAGGLVPESTLLKGVSRFLREADPHVVRRAAELRVAPGLGPLAVETILGALGAGKKSSEYSEPIRALVISSTDVGADKRGSVGEESVVYRTYRGLADLMVRHGREEFSRLAGTTDAVLLLHPESEGDIRMSRTVKELMHYAVTVAVMTDAPGAKADVRSTKSKLLIRDSIGELSCRQAIEQGVANGVQLFALRGARLRRGTEGAQNWGISQDDLNWLARDKGRSDAVARVVRQLLGSGRRGVLRAVADSEHTHAQAMADLIRRGFSGPGSERPVVEVVSSSHGPEEWQAAIRRLEQGETSLLVCDAAPSGLSGEGVEFIVDAGFGGSFEDKARLLGPGLAPKDRMTILVDVYDQCPWEAMQSPLFFDMVGEPLAWQGVAITSTRRGSDGSVTQTIPRPRTRRANRASPNGEVQGGQISYAAVIAKLTIEGISLGIIKEGWVAFDAAGLAEQYGCSRNAITSRMRSALAATPEGYQPILYKGYLFVPPNTEQLLARRSTAPFMIGDVVARQLIERLAGVSRDCSDEVVRGAGIDVLSGRNPLSLTKKEAQFLGMEGALRFLSYLAENYIPINPEQDCECDEVAQELGRSRDQVRKSIAAEIEAGNLPGVTTYLRAPADGHKRRTCFPREHKEQVKAALLARWTRRRGKQSDNPATASMTESAQEQDLDIKIPSKTSPSVTDGEHGYRREPIANTDPDLETRQYKTFARVDALAEAGRLEPDEAGRLRDYLLYFRDGPTTVSLLPEDTRDKLLDLTAEDDYRVLAELLHDDPQVVALRLIARGVISIPTRKMGSDVFRNLAQLLDDMLDGILDRMMSAGPGAVS